MNKLLLFLIILVIIGVIVVTLVMTLKPHQDSEPDPNPAPLNKCEGTYCANGTCDPSNGKCVCHPGWSGPTCRNNACNSIKCDKHQICDPQTGKCICNKNAGWSNVDGKCVCESKDCKVCTRNTDCNGKGVCDIDKGTCKCDPGWSGPNCETNPCIGMKCGIYQICDQGKCICNKDAGWSNVNGKCVCESKDCKVCTTNYDCNLKGICDIDKGTCKCLNGWSGPNCETKPETLNSDHEGVI